MISTPSRLRMLLAAGAIALTALAPWPAQAATHSWPPPRVGALFRYWQFDDHNDLHDYITYWATGPVFVQFEYWDFTNPDAPDQFRPEVHYTFRDGRASTYDIGWRHEYQRERLMFGTEQLVGGRWVARAGVSPIIWSDSVKTVLSAGADYYFGSYSFASATVIRDPRSGGLWVFPMRVRIADEQNNWVQGTVSPTTDRSIGWAFDAKWRWMLLGVERNSRYDFTNVDNMIYTLGVELPFPVRAHDSP